MDAPLRASTGLEILHATRRDAPERPPLGEDGFGCHPIEGMGEDAGGCVEQQVPCVNECARSNAARSAVIPDDDPFRPGGETGKVGREQE